MFLHGLAFNQSIALSELLGSPECHFLNFALNPVAGLVGWVILFSNLWSVYFAIIEIMSPMKDMVRREDFSPSCLCLLPLNTDLGINYHGDSIWVIPYFFLAMSQCFSNAMSNSGIQHNTVHSVLSVRIFDLSCSDKKWCPVIVGISHIR